ncbi:hypothetical protein OF83DRAFT_73491 [Amylostereum chailletii]|nr:hypothetical protein OF83DRAFT_73491 [Amylostereum chailletii]
MSLSWWSVSGTERAPPPPHLGSPRLMEAAVAGIWAAAGDRVSDQVCSAVRYTLHVPNSPSFLSFRRPPFPPLTIMPVPASPPAADPALDDRVVRFDDACVLIPPPGPRSRLPRLLSRAYSLPPLFRRREPSLEPEPALIPPVDRSPPPIALSSSFMSSLPRSASTSPILRLTSSVIAQTLQKIPFPPFPRLTQAALSLPRTPRPFFSPRPQASALPPPPHRAPQPPWPPCPRLCRI